MTVNAVWTRRFESGTPQPRGHDGRIQRSTRATDGPARRGRRRIPSDSSSDDKREKDRFRRRSARGRELARLTEQRRRARKSGAPISDLSEQDWQDILAEFNDACAYCLTRGIPLEQEHMQPLSRGGSHTKTNVVPACGPCNRKKGTRTLLGSLQVLHPLDQGVAA